VFVSLHAPGGLRPPSGEVRIFYYRDIEGNRRLPGNQSSAAEISVWESRQIESLEASKALAAEIKKQLYARVPGIKVQIEDAPLAVLAGADMPAVLIEAPDLAVSIGAKPRHAWQRMEAFAQGIAVGIKDFLSANAP
jgi:N-acetylmuramoyl-L-alanine amidase